jgi:hypothetical protein
MFKGPTAGMPDMKAMMESTHRQFEKWDVSFARYAGAAADKLAALTQKALAEDADLTYPLRGYTNIVLMEAALRATAETGVVHPMIPQLVGGRHDEDI